jgi:hypothetical protein
VGTGLEAVARELRRRGSECLGAVVRGSARWRQRYGCEQRASRAWERGAEARRGRGRGRCGCGRESEGTAMMRRLGETGALGKLNEVGNGLRRKRQNERDPKVRLKRVRSAFYAMTGRGGRMTGRGGGSVRSQSSKLLE